MKSSMMRGDVILLWYLATIWQSSGLRVVIWAYIIGVIFDLNLFIIHTLSYKNCLD